MATHGEQLFLKRVGDGRFTRPRQTREPQHRRALALQLGACALVDIKRLHMDVRRAAQRKVDHARTDRLVRQAVDQNKAARVAVFIIGIEGNLAIKIEVTDTNFIEAQRPCRMLFHRVDVDGVARLCNCCLCCDRADFHQVCAARQQLVFAHPQDRRAELVRDFAGFFGGADHIAARDINLVRKCDRHRLARHRLVEITVMGDDAFDGAFLCGGQRFDLVTRRDAARGDLTRKPAKIEIGTVHPLHGHTERFVAQGVVDLHRFQIRHQRRAIIPRRLG